MNVHQQFEAEDSQGTDLLASLPQILWQRRWFVIVPFVLCAIAGLAAAYLLPRTYRTQATMVVESQNVPIDLGSSSSGEVIDRRIARIRQQLLSRPDLVQMIQANDLYGASRRTEPLSALVERMRQATTLQAIDARVSNGPSGSSSIAFQLTFQYPEAVPAQLVAQTFVDRLLRLDASEAQSQADENVRFLEDQQASLQEQVTALEGEINRITGQNGVALANAGGSFMMSGGGGYESQIASIQRDNAQLAAQLGAGQDTGVAQAEAQLAAVKAIYADNHPDVKLAESRLAAARGAASTNSGPTRGDQAIRAQIATNNNLIRSITEARSAEQARAAQIMAAQARGPVIAQQVNQLQSRAESLRANLARVNSGLVNAQSLAKLASEQRGERLMLVDPPVTPDKPTSPNRLMLIAGGIAGGGTAGLALALLIELLLRPIRSVDSLTRLTGAPPLGVVPIVRLARAGRDRSGGSRLRRILFWPLRAIAWPFKMLFWPFRKLAGLVTGRRRREGWSGADGLA